MDDHHETETGAEFISPIHVRHIMRYIDALKYISSGDYVIDAACGTGYGTYLVAKKCVDGEVRGIDISDDAINYAKKNFSDSGARFVKHDLLDRFNDNSPGDNQDDQWVLYGWADVVLSIETIEHFEKCDIDRYLDNLTWMLKSGGKLIISTPYSEVSGPSPVTKQHLYEFNMGELVNYLLSKKIYVNELNMTPAPGLAGRLGYAMLVCTI